jgi:hypothetical protein
MANDVSKTFPELKLFQLNNGAFHEKLCNLLEAVAVHVPDVGYVSHV